MTRLQNLPAHHFDSRGKLAAPLFTSALQVIAVLVQLYILSRIEAVGSNTEKVTVKTKNMKG